MTRYQDQFGELALPAPVAAAGATAADPGLDVILAYLQAVLNSRASAAWAAIAPSTSPPVRSVHAHNPSDAEFSVANLPALYGWRTEGDTEWRADDYELALDKIELLWVFPLAFQKHRDLRAPFANAVSKIWRQAIHQGRDPSWVVPGDPDPQAATRGSNFWDQGGFFRVTAGRWQYAAVQIDKGDSKPAYAALHLPLLLEELLTLGQTAFAPGQPAVQLTVQTTDDPPFVLDELDLDFPLP